mmetsp:Transcript_1339/g.1459  ORF Transcript_1339/g.1459 Transcript_1339/m.1459 type:complete len:243 (+) Transcript_1339:55-783(+)
MNRILVLRLRRCRWQQQQRGPRKILDSTSSMMAILILVSTMILLFLSEGVVVTEGFGWSNSNSNSIRTTNHKMNSVTTTTTTTTNGDNAATNIDITPRAVAVFALMESMKKKNGIAIRLLENNPAYRHLDRRDRAFARLLLSTSERRSGQLERIIHSFQHKNNNNKSNSNSNSNNNNKNDDKQENKKKKKKPSKPRLSDLLTEAALQIGATQLLFMDTPVYAAVSETVESLRMHPKITVSYV